MEQLFAVQGAVTPTIRKPKSTAKSKRSDTQSSMSDCPSLCYKLSGTWDRLHPCLLLITELPVGQWTENYKQHLARMRDPKNMKKQKKTAATSAATAKRKKTVPVPTIEVRFLALPFNLLKVPL